MTVVYDMGDVKMPNGEEDNGDSTVTNVQIVAVPSSMMLVREALCTQFFNSSKCVERTFGDLTNCMIGQITSM